MYSSRQLCNWRLMHDDEWRWDHHVTVDMDDVSWSEASLSVVWASVLVLFCGLWALVCLYISSQPQAPLDSHPSYFLLDFEPWRTAACRFSRLDQSGSVPSRGVYSASVTASPPALTAQRVLDEHCMLHNSNLINSWTLPLNHSIEHVSTSASIEFYRVSRLQLHCIDLHTLYPFHMLVSRRTTARSNFCGSPPRGSRCSPACWSTR